ncbi:MAG: indole-3-glycerol phosphate synthase TrpC [Candidatus Gastranaerophilales bacterium]|nr:indole-3-glycerol phosphate synthase TrpC [Candidatus Gastranaerophilales bacterium]
MNFLDKIIAYKEMEVQKQKIELDLNELKNICRKLTSSKSLIEKLKLASSRNKLALIAEVKKASPSKGLIRKDFDPVAIALAYQNAGASSISVLTDEKFFQGSIQYLKAVRNTLDLPILRKDFIIDPYQIYQTRAIGADIILLIASALTPEKLKEFYILSRKIGLEVLLEVHDKQELDLALSIGAEIIGINNRNLETFEVSIQNTLNLIKDIDLLNKFIISESGISAYSDIITLKNKGISGVLIGESFMKQENIEIAVHNLMMDCI